MIKLIRHAIRVAYSAVREATKGIRRSGHWPAVRKAHLAASPACATCGSKTRLQVHHIKPFHLDPALELDPTNLITLCMGKYECHILIGHGDSFKAYNPMVVEHSHTLKVRPDLRKKIEILAKRMRLPD